MNNVKQTTSRKNYLDAIRALAIISVVALHAMQRTGMPYIGGALIYGVPLFLMISGGLMIEKAEKLSVSQFYIKYGKRIVQFVVLIPICAIVTNSLLWYCMGNVDLSTANARTSIPQYMQVGSISLFEAFLKALTQANGVFPDALNMSQSHVWYLYLITSLYISLPYISRITKAMSTRALLLLCVLMIGSSLTIPCFISSLLRTFNISYMIYFIVGYIIVSRKFLLDKKSSCLLLISLVTMLLCSMIPCIKPIADQMNLFIKVCICSMIILLAFQYDRIFKWKMIQNLSRCSFGIYLWHFAILWLTSIFLPAVQLTSPFRFLIFFGISLGGAWILTIILSRFRWTRWLVA